MIGRPELEQLAKGTPYEATEDLLKFWDFVAWLHDFWPQIPTRNIALPRVLLTRPLGRKRQLTNDP